MALAKEDMYTRVLCSQNSIGILYFRDEGNTRLLVLKPHNLREGKKKRKKKDDDNTIETRGLMSGDPGNG